MKRFEICVLCLIIGLILAVPTVSAQGTAFSYQGSLKSGGNAANGNFDFEFRLFNASSFGVQLGQTQTFTNIAVTNGIFSFILDFDNQFQGAARWLEISVRQTGGGAFTILTPRQSINSSPYSTRSLFSQNANVAGIAVNSQSLGGITADQYVTTADGGTNFIQNSTSQQSSSNFNISGNGTVGGTLSGNVVNTATQYRIGGATVFRIAASGTFIGAGAGGLGTGTSNSFFGNDAGNQNTTGSNNSFFGRGAGFGTTIGEANVFIGNNAGSSNVNGRGNTLVGYETQLSEFGLFNATAIGNRARVGASNSLVLGSVNGENGCTIQNNCDSVNVGIGTISPTSKLHVSGTGTIRAKINSNSNAGLELTLNNSPGWSISTVNTGQLQISNDFLLANALTIDRFSNVLSVNSLGAAGSTQLCRNASNEISTCSSSLRYKTNFSPFSDGLLFINQLRPISFDWKDGGMHDVGFGAEEVERINPLFVSYNEKGEVEGVKYDRLSVAFVNAFKEQQTQIESQARQINEQKDLIKKQQETLDALKQFICSQNSSAALCQ